MAEAAIPVDLFNPGQVFACLGFMEAAEILLGGACGGFDWSGPETRFLLRAEGDADPVASVLAFLADAEVFALTPQATSYDLAKWNIPAAPEREPGVLDLPPPDTPATLSALLKGPGPEGAPHEVRVSHWGDPTMRDNVKFWAGSGGYPGAALFRDALELVRHRLRQETGDPFGVAALQSSSFRFDWRRDYIPIDAGFSPNAHGKVDMLGYPVVEMLAAIGMTHARPLRHDKLSYSYAVLGRAPADVLAPLALHRAALGCAPLPLRPRRRFGFTLGWPGQEGQARCILDVTEETVP
jgi:CRISPR-associated protein Csb3